MTSDILFGKWLMNGIRQRNKNRKFDPWPLGALAPPIPISCLCLKVSGHPGFAVHLSHFGVPCLFFGCGLGNFIGKNHSAGSDYDHTISMDGLERTSAEKCGSGSPNIRLPCFQIACIISKAKDWTGKHGLRPSFEKTDLKWSQHILWKIRCVFTQHILQTFHKPWGL